MSGTPCDACDNDARSVAAKDDADVMGGVREFYERLGMNIKVDRVRRKMRQREKTLLRIGCSRPPPTMMPRDTLWNTLPYTSSPQSQSSK